MDNSNIISALVIIFLLIILDGLWISINSKMYSDMYSKVQNSPMEINKLGAIISYMFIFISLFVIILPRLKKANRTITDCLIQSGLVGLTIYGIYNFTNLATLKNYSFKVAVIDTLWGGLLYTIIGIVLKFLILKI